MTFCGLFAGFKAPDAMESDDRGCGPHRASPIEAASRRWSAWPSGPKSAWFPAQTRNLATAISGTGAIGAIVKAEASLPLGNRAHRRKRLGSDNPRRLPADRTVGGRVSTTLPPHAEHDG